MGDVEVLRPDAGGESVLGVVAEGDGFGGGAEGHRDEDGAEDFFLGDGGGGFDVGEEGRGEPESVGGEVAGGLEFGGTFADAFFDEAGDAFELGAIDDGSEVDGFVEGATDAEGFHAGADFGVELFGDAFLDEESGAGAADLALVEPDGIDEAFYGAVEVGVIEDDEGGFSAEFERELFRGSGGDFADDAPDFGGAGEGDFVDVGVFDNGFSDFAVAGDDADDAFGDARFLADFGEEEGGEGGEFGGFEDDGVAHGEGGGDLPAQHEEGEVPRNDLAADADGLVVGEFGVAELGPSGVVVEVSGDEGDVDVAGFADGFAVVEGFEDGEESRVFLDFARDGVEDFGSFGSRKTLPGGEGFFCGLDGLVDLLGGGLGDLGEFFSVGGVEGGEGGF